MAILIGSEPNFDFLPPDIAAKLRGVDSKLNPVPVDPVTFEHPEEPDLFFIGPAAGDNFVRFAIPHAFGVASHLMRKNKIF